MSKKKDKKKLLKKLAALAKAHADLKGKTNRTKLRTFIEEKIIDINAFRKTLVFEKKEQQGLIETVVPEKNSPFPFSENMSNSRENQNENEPVS